MKHLYVEVANDPIKRECGLMNRKSMGKNNGMLFKFPYSYRLSFWMKNTYIPLDIAYVDEKGKILQIEQMIPLNTRAVVSNNECRYALEVNKDWFKQNDIKIGNYIGGVGFDFNRKAQMTPPPELPLDPNAPQQPQQPQQLQPSPDVMLNKTTEEILKDADRKGVKLTIIYRKEDGFVLPPKTISPPYELRTVKRKSDGARHKEVHCWDDQEGQEKTFFIDGIESIELAQKNLEEFEQQQRNNIDKVKNE